MLPTKNNSVPALRAVLFDLDDTLHDDTLNFTQAAAHVADHVSTALNVNAGDLRDAFIEELQNFWKCFQVSDLRAGENVRARMWAEAFRRFAIDDPALATRCADEFEEARRGNYRLFPEVDDLLGELHARGLKVGLLTNGLKTTHREKIALLGLEERLDAIFLSDEIGMEKPDRRIFFHACSVLQAAPESTVMVGDRFDKDIEGALNAGLQAIWINVRNEAPPAAYAKTFIAVSSLEQAASVLKGAIYS